MTLPTSLAGASARNTPRALLRSMGKSVFVRDRCLAAALPARRDAVASSTFRNIAENGRTPVAAILQNLRRDVVGTGSLATSELARLLEQPLAHFRWRRR